MHWIKIDSIDEVDWAYEREDGATISGKRINFIGKDFYVWSLFGKDGTKLYTFERSNTKEPPFKWADIILADEEK